MESKLNEIISKIPFEPYFSDEYGVIYNNDCLNIISYLTGVDLLITDPPYNIHCAGGGDDG